MSDVPGETVGLYRVRNEGRWAANQAGLAADDLANAGTLDSDNGRLRLGGNWSNAGGTVRAVNRSDVEITTAPADFGAFMLTDSTLALAGNGTFTTAQINNRFVAVRSNLAVRAGATLDNTGSTLSLNGYDFVTEGGTVRAEPSRPAPAGRNVASGGP